MKNKPVLSLKAAIQLAAPHTWPSSILPVLLGAALSLYMGQALRPVLLLCTLLTAVLLQSAVNTLNDCADFLSGLDSAENCKDSSDAALIYECSSPKAALALGLLFLLMATVFGGVLTAAHGAAMLLYGALGLAAILLYTLPGISFSALPLGEVLSGAAMGGVLTAAAFHAQHGSFEPRLIFLCLPAVIMIGSVMLTNNTADIEKDSAVRRKTLALCLGRKNSARLLRAAILISALLVCAFTFAYFTKGIIALPAMAAALLLHKGCRFLFREAPSPENRSFAMKAVLGTLSRINGAYIASILLTSVFN